MNNMHDQSLNYLRDILPIPALSAGEWEGRGSVPRLLAAAYDTSVVTIFDHEFLWVCARVAEESPSVLEKHLAYFEKNSGYKTVYISRTLSAYARRRFIQDHISFIIPGSQCFLYPLCIFLQERKSTPVNSSDYFSPAAQLLLLYWIYEKHVFFSGTQQVLAKKLGYTTMTISRAFHEIMSAVQNREIPAPEQSKDIFLLFVPFLRSPVKRRIFLADSLPVTGYVAGVNALAEQSMIQKKERPSIAMSAQQWKKYAMEIPVQECPQQDAQLEIEIWKYDPAVLGNKNRVDPLSLYLSLSGTHDPRITLCLEELIDTVALYTPQRGLL